MVNGDSIKTALLQIQDKADNESVPPNCDEVKDNETVPESHKDKTESDGHVKLIKSRFAHKYLIWGFCDKELNF